MSSQENKLVPQNPQRTYSLVRYLAGYYETQKELDALTSVMVRAQLAMEQNSSSARRGSLARVSQPLLRLIGKDEESLARVTIEEMMQKDREYQLALQRKNEMILDVPRESIVAESNMQVFDPIGEQYSFTETRHPPVSHRFYQGGNNLYANEFAFLKVDPYDGNITIERFAHTSINGAWKDIPTDDASGYEKRFVIGIWSYDKETYHVDQEWILKGEEKAGSYESYFGLRNHNQQNEFYYRVRVPINTAHPLTHFEIRRMERHVTQERRT